MNVPEVIKKNKIKSSLAIIATILPIIGGILTVDDRYAKAADITQIQTSFIKSQNRHEIRDLEDKVFIIELKEADGEATKYELALKERYLRRLKELKIK